METTEGKEVDLLAALMELTGLEVQDKEKVKNLKVFVLPPGLLRGRCRRKPISS